MKTISSELTAHFGTACTTLALIFKVRRTDGEVFGFTTFDQDITFDMGDIDGEVLFLAETGAASTATTSKDDLSVDNQDVTGFLDSEVITEQDIRAGLWSNADIQIAIVNWADLTQGCMKLRKGTTGEIKLKNGAFTSEVRGLAQKLTAQIVYTYGPLCRAELGSHSGNSDSTWLCGVDLDLYVQDGVVDSIPDATHITPVAGLLKVEPVESEEDPVDVIGASPFPALPDAGFLSDNHTHVLVIKGGAVALAGTYAFTVTLKAGSQPLIITRMVVKKTAAGSTTVSTTTPMQFAAADGVSISAAGTATSDPVNVAFDSSHDYYIEVYVQGTGNNGTALAFSSNDTGSDCYMLTNAAAGDVTGDTTLALTGGDTTWYLFSGIEFVPPPDFDGAPAGWFDNGIVTFNAGPMDGFKLEIKTWDGTTLTLYLPMPFQPEPGDTFTIEPGCKKTIGDCQSKFVNIENFRGEPHIPGVLVTSNYPDAK